MARAPRGGFLVGFVREVVSELRKVVWPTREEATRLTIMVLAVSITVGVALGLIDIGFHDLVGWLISAK
jgi:preprotein translocase subunit SecE